MVKRLMLGLALVLAVVSTACAGAASSGADSGVQGKVMVGPTCPVERADSPCPDSPAGGATVQVLDSSEAVVASGTSASDGSFRVAVEAGSYQVKATRDSAIGRETRPVEVTVTSGEFVTVTLMFDSGIR